MTSLKFFIFITIFATIIIIVLSQCAQPNNINHDKIIKTLISSNNRYKAEIKTDKTFSYYFLTIKNMHGDSTLIFDSLICIKSYHNPIINLNWKDPQSLLEISVDNDFGENVQFYIFDTERKELSKTE